MTAAEVQDLVSEAPCDMCATPGLAYYLVLAALFDLANGEDVPMTIQELTTQANCLLCVSPGMVPYLMIAAIRQISTGGGIGGGGESGSGSPEGVVTADPGVTYWDTADQSLWVKDTGAGNTGWVQVIA